MAGWIKLHRKLVDNPIFKDQNLLQVWIYCLLKASFEEKQVLMENKMIPLEAGEFIAGRMKGASETGLTPSTFDRALKRLEKFGYIERKPNRRFTVVKVLKWGLYQGLDTDERTEVEQKLNRSRTEVEHIQEVKELKEVKESNKRSKFSPESYQLAELLKNAILERDPNTKVPNNLSSWAVEADRMLRLDRREYGEAVELIVWCQQDDFWSANILSMKKFRKQYDRLKRQKQRDKPKKGVISREPDPSEFLGYKFN